jgi:hypothetical protein
MIDILAAAVDGSITVTGNQILTGLAGLVAMFLGFLKWAGKYLERIVTAHLRFVKTLEDGMPIVHENLTSLKHGQDQARAEFETGASQNAGLLGRIAELSAESNTEMVKLSKVKTNEMLIEQGKTLESHSFSLSKINKTITVVDSKIDIIKESVEHIQSRSLGEQS